MLNQQERTHLIINLLSITEQKNGNLKNQINNTKVFIILGNPHHSLKTHHKFNRAKYQNSKTAI